MHPADKALSPPPFADEPPPALRQAVTALVRAKARVDRLAQGGPDDRALAARCGVDGMAEMRQVHGDTTVFEPDSVEPSTDPTQEADGMVRRGGLAGFLGVIVSGVVAGIVLASVLMPQAEPEPVTTGAPQDPRDGVVPAPWPYFWNVTLKK